MARGPLELVLLAKVHGEVVAPGEALVTHMTLVPRLRVPLVGREGVVTLSLGIPTAASPPPSAAPLTSCTFR